MGEFLLIWISKSSFEQAITLLILAAFLGLVAFIAYKFIMKLKGSGDPTATLTPEGIRFGFKAKNKDTTSMEQKVMSFFEARNKKQEEEIKELREEVSQLRVKLLNLESQMKIRDISEENLRKEIIPIEQHEIFTNLKKVMEQGLSFPFLQDDDYKRKVYLARVFIEECRSPAFFKYMKEIVDTVDTKISEEDKMSVLFTLPDMVYKAIDEYMSNAVRKELVFNNICIIGIPTCFLKRYKEWNAPHVELAISKIRKILYSSFYHTWQMKLIMCLDIIDTILSMVESELVSTINSLNGEVAIEINKKIQEAKCQ